MWDVVSLTDVMESRRREEKNGPEAIFKSVKDKKFSNRVRHQPTDLRSSVNTKQDKLTNTQAR